MYLSQISKSKNHFKCSRKARFDLVLSVEDKNFWQLNFFQEYLFMPSHLRFEIHQPQYLLQSPFFSLSLTHHPPLFLAATHKSAILERWK